MSYFDKDLRHGMPARFCATQTLQSLVPARSKNPRAVKGKPS